MSVYIPENLRQQVRERFNNICAYCRTAEFLTIGVFQIDHIIPRVAGGPTSFENLCLACPPCNRFKGIKQEANDPLTNETIILFHPNINDWYENFAWNENKTKIIGLTPMGRATVELLKMNRPKIVNLRKMWVALQEYPPENL